MAGSLPNPKRSTRARGADEIGERQVLNRAGSGSGQRARAVVALVLDYEPGTERYVKILANGDRLITVIEFLSPSNKGSFLTSQQQRNRNHPTT